MPIYAVWAALFSPSHSCISPSLFICIFYSLSSFEFETEKRKMRLLLRFFLIILKYHITSYQFVCRENEHESIYRFNVLWITIMWNSFSDWYIQETKGKLSLSYIFEPLCFIRSVWLVLSMYCKVWHWPCDKTNPNNARGKTPLWHFVQ